MSAHRALVPALRSVAAFCIATVTTVAQATWTVSASGGAQFTTIQAAVQAAGDGDTILVQPTGVYALNNFLLTKGVAIVGAGASPTPVAGLLQIYGIAANKRAALCNLIHPSTGSGSFSLTVANCAGSVCCENLALDGYDRSAFPIAAGETVTILSCASVSLHGCNAFGWPSIDAMNSSVAVSECTIRGIGADPFYTTATFAREAIAASGCRLALTACTLTGGGGGTRAGMNGANAVTCRSTRVLAAATQFTGGVSTVTPGQGITLDATSRLESDPACQFLGGVLSTTPGSVTQVEICRVTGTAAPPGGTTSVTSAGPVGDAAMLFIALPQPPLALTFGVVWLDPATTAILQSGLLPLPPASVPIPAPTLRGMAFAVQAGLLHFGAVQLSPPLVTIVP